MKIDGGTLNKESLRVPPPGAYDIKGGERYRNSSKFSFGSAKRPELNAGKGKGVPGPNNYKVKTTIGEGPKFHMGVRTAGALKTTQTLVPGPGQYSPVRVKDTGSAYSMGSKSKFGMTIAVNPESGTHTKIALSQPDNPGPGTYTPTKRFKRENQFGKFGMETRNGMASKSAADLPGPNVYDSNSKRFVLKSAPAFGFGTSKRPQSSTTKN